MEQTHDLLNAIIGAHTKSDTGDLPVDVLNHMGKFSEYVDFG
jgi:hypothetical protein